MKFIALSLLTLFLSLAINAPALAQDPTPTPAVAGLDTSPYDYENGASVQLPSMDFVSIGVINTVVKSARTILEMVKVLKLYLYVFLIILAFWVLKWLYSQVINRTVGDTEDISPATDTGGDEPEGDEAVMERVYYSNPYKVYRTTFKVKRK